MRGVSLSAFAELCHLSQEPICTPHPHRQPWRGLLRGRGGNGMPSTRTVANLQVSWKALLSKARSLRHTLRAVGRQAHAARSGSPVRKNKSTVAHSRVASLPVRQAPQHDRTYGQCRQFSLRPIGQYRALPVVLLALVLRDLSDYPAELPEIG